MFSYINEFLSDPIHMLLFLLLALPGRMLAISTHEFAHAWAAYRAGDSTAKNAGRLTLNPIKHLDLIGTLMMLLLGFGWAKPVPINPRYFQNPRKDDLKVSLAGVTANAILFLLGTATLYIWLALWLSSFDTIPSGSLRYGTRAITFYEGDMCYFNGAYLYDIRALVSGGVFLGDFITAEQGWLAGILYKMLGYFVQTNLALAIFNLIPIPPLDGYHVLNDLVLRKSLFASQRFTQYSTVAMLVLMATGMLSRFMSTILGLIWDLVGSISTLLFSAAGLF